MASSVQRRKTLERKSAPKITSPINLPIRKERITRIIMVGPRCAAHLERWTEAVAVVEEQLPSHGSGGGQAKRNSVNAARKQHSINVSERRT